MASYAQITNEALDYIKAHLSASIRVSDLSQHVYKSEFHFNGCSAPQLGSVLKMLPGQKTHPGAVAAQALKDSLIKIVLDLGFEYPEVFSRTFKKQYGISPRRYRAQQPVPPVPKADVIVRNWVNYQGTLVVKSVFIEPPLELQGLGSNVDMLQSNAERDLACGW